VSVSGWFGNTEFSLGHLRKTPVTKPIPRHISLCLNSRASIVTPCPSTKRSMAIPTKMKRGLFPVDAAGRVHHAWIPLVNATTEVDFVYRGFLMRRNAFLDSAFILLLKSLACSLCSVPEYLFPGWSGASRSHFHARQSM
jgi:hypothetical protein